MSIHKVEPSRVSRSRPYSIVKLALTYGIPISIKPGWAQIRERKQSSFLKGFDVPYWKLYYIPICFKSNRLITFIDAEWNTWDVRKYVNYLTLTTKLTDDLRNVRINIWNEQCRIFRYSVIRYSADISKFQYFEY